MEEVVKEYKIKKMGAGLGKTDSSGRGVAIGLTNSHQLWSPAQSLQDAAHHITSQLAEGITRELPSLPLSEAPGS